MSLGCGAEDGHMSVKKIIFLDDNEDLRIITSRLIKNQLGIDCITCASYEEFINQSEQILDSNLVILDINLGTEATGVDAYHWLFDNDYKGKVFFLTGYDQTNNLVEDVRSEGAAIFQKPLETKKFIQLVNQAIL